MWEQWFQDISYLKSNVLFNLLAYMKLPEHLDKPSISLPVLYSILASKLIMSTWVTHCLRRYHSNHKINQHKVDRPEFGHKDTCPASPCKDDDRRC